MGIEPTSKAWEAFVLPLNYTRLSVNFTPNIRSGKTCRAESEFGPNVSPPELLQLARCMGSNYDKI